MQHGPRRVPQSILSEAYVADILLTLGKSKKGINASDLLKIHGYYRKMIEKVGKLESLGLVTVDVDQSSGHTNKKTIKLTAQGKKALSFIIQFDKLALKSEIASMRAQSASHTTSSKSNGGGNKMRLRILEEVLVPRGIGGSCLLKKDDIVMLPKTIADALLGGEKAREALPEDYEEDGAIEPQNID